MSEVSGVEMPTVGDFARVFRRLQSEIHKVIVGHEQAVEELLMALFAGGHVLIEGVPGTGKTTLVKTLGLALNLSFNRIQFTVDLMPADITGTRVILTTDDGRRDFQFQRGPGVLQHSARRRDQSRDARRRNPRSWRRWPSCRSPSPRKPILSIHRSS